MNIFFKKFCVLSLLFISGVLGVNKPCPGAEAKRLEVATWETDYWKNEPFRAIIYQTTSLQNDTTYEMDFSYSNKIMTTLAGISKIIEPFDYYVFMNGGVLYRIYHHDLNGDGIEETIFGANTDDNRMPEIIYIYAINFTDTSASLIETFDGLNKGYENIEMKDLDNDSTLEVVAWSNYYRDWRTYYCMMSPKLVWKWDGEEYRLANFKLSEAILKIEYGTDTSLTGLLSRFAAHDAQNCNFWPDSIGCYPINLMNGMLELIYSGKADAADKLLYQTWPDPARGRYQFHEFFWRKVKSDPFWKELQESDW